MSAIGFSFTKIDITRVNNPKGKISVTHDIQLEAVKDAKLKVEQAEKQGLFVEFSYTVSYKPVLGKIRFEGNFLHLSEDAKKIAEEFKDDKKMDAKLKEVLYNTINQKCLVKAISLAELVNLPQPINLPRLKVSEK